MEKLITYVGLDVHKVTIAVAVGEAGKRGEVREYGTIEVRHRYPPVSTATG